MGCTLTAVRPIAAYRQTQSLQLVLRVRGHLALTDFRPEEPKWTLAYGWRRRWQHYKYRRGYYYYYYYLISWPSFVRFIKGSLVLLSNLMHLCTLLLRCIFCVFCCFYRPATLIILASVVTSCEVWRRLLTLVGRSVKPNSLIHSSSSEYTEWIRGSTHQEFKDYHTFIRSSNVCHNSCWSKIVRSQHRQIAPPLLTS